MGRYAAKLPDLFMLKKLIFSVVAGVVTLVAIFAATLKDPEQQANCLLSKIPVAVLYDMGSEPSSPSWSASKWDSLLCAPASQWEPGSIEEVERLVREKIERTEAFRNGQYGKLLHGTPPNLNVVAFVQLGAYLEATALIRHSTLKCEAAAAPAIAQLAELDLPYAMAVLGERVGVPTERLATSLAVALFTVVDERAKKEVPLACGETLSKRFEAQASDWLAFAEGRNPVVPNCRAVPEGGDMLLQCRPSQ